MTRTFDSDQSPLWVRSELVRVDLVHLQTYTDRVENTVDENFYFSRAPVLFDWDNNGTDIEFWPVLKEIGSLRTSINHLPSPGDSSLVRKRLEITLSNEPFGVDADRLINTLRDGHILENATIEWTQIALAERPTTARIDLTDLAGDEHTYWYRGRVVQVGPITNSSITLQCETDIPSPVPLKALDSTKNDPADYGRRLPIVYGEAKRVKAIGYEVGWVTTLAEDITSGFTGVANFTDLSGISGSVTARIEAEEVSLTYVSDTTGNITARAQNSTTAAAHDIGASVVEMISSIVYVVAGHAVDAINEIYMRSPIDGSLVRLDSSELSYTASTSDVSTISGETVASVTFTQAEFRSVMEYLSASGTVTQQPDFETDAGEFVFVPASAFQAWVGAVTDCGSLLDVDGGRVYGDSGSTYGVEWYWPSGSVADSTREVVSWRIKAVCSGRAGISSGNYDTYLEIEPDNIPGLTNHASKTFTDYNAVEYFATAVTAFQDATGGTVLGDLESAGGSGNPRLLMDCQKTGSGSTWNGNNFAWCLHNEIGIEAELAPQTLTRTDDVEIDTLGAAMGNGIELWADVDGYVAPDETPAYKAGAGNLMTKPADIIRHWIEHAQVIRAVGCTLLASCADGNDQTSYTTASMSPTGDVTIIAAISNRKIGSSPDTPTISGNGLSWTQIATVTMDPGSAQPGRLTLFRASGSSPTTGSATIDFSGSTQSDCCWIFQEFDGSDTTTNDGVVQSASNTGTGTSLTVTLAAFDDTSNYAFGAFAEAGGVASYRYPGSGFTEIENTYSGGSVSCFAEYKATEDTSVDCTWSTSVDTGGIAIEIAVSEPVTQPGGTVDTDSYDDCATNLGSDAWAFDARTLGDTWEACLARMGFEGRCTIVPEEFSTGTKFKLLTALSTYAFPAASGSITEWDHDGVVEAGQNAVDTNASRFTFYYEPFWNRGEGEEAFSGVVIANEDTNDLTTPNTAAFATAADYIGRIEAEPVAFRAIREEATAEEIAGYYCHERIAVPRRTIAVRGVPCWEAYALEVGDIVEITPGWASSAIKCRVLEYVKDPATEQIELRLVEVE